MLKGLNAEKARIFRITHRENVSWIIENGLHCHSSDTVDPNFVVIGNTELIAKRQHHPVPCEPGGTLNDYVPFYFTPFSPMFYNIRTGHNGIQQRTNDEIVILASSLPKLIEQKIPLLFTDRHAYLIAAQFYSDSDDLDQIDWPLLQSRNFARNPDDPGQFERYQAEALVYKHVPTTALLGIVCYSDSVASSFESDLAESGIQLKIAVKPKWYFQ